MKQTRLVVHTIKQSRFLDVYASIHKQVNIIVELDVCDWLIEIDLNQKTHHSSRLEFLNMNDLTYWHSALLLATNTFR